MTPGQVFNQRYWVVANYVTGGVYYCVHGVCGYMSDKFATKADAEACMIAKSEPRMLPNFM